MGLTDAQGFKGHNSKLHLGCPVRFFFGLGKILKAAQETKPRFRMVMINVNAMFNVINSSSSSCFFGLEPREYHISWVAYVNFNPSGSTWTQGV